MSLYVFEMYLLLRFQDVCLYVRSLWQAPTELSRNNESIGTRRTWEV